jgi:hypothetical protein
LGIEKNFPMKKSLLNSAFVMASLLGAVGSAPAQTLHARIPSRGWYDNAGRGYTISVMFHAPQVLLFENEGTKVQTIVFARTVSGLPAKATPLTFGGSSGDHMVLTNITASGWTYELNAIAATKPLKGVALTLTSGGK